MVTQFWSNTYLPGLKISLLVLLAVLIPIGAWRDRIRTAKIARTAERQKDTTEVDRLNTELQAAKSALRELRRTVTAGLPAVTAALDEAFTSTSQTRIRTSNQNLRTAILFCALTLSAEADGSRGPRASCYLYDEDNQQLVLARPLRGRADLPQHATFTLDDIRARPELRNMLMTGVPQVVRDVPPRPDGKPSAYRSYVSAPVRDGQGQVYGFISVDHTDPGEMEDQDAQVVQILGQILGSALARDTQQSALPVDQQDPDDHAILGPPHDEEGPRR